MAVQSAQAVGIKPISASRAVRLKEYYALRKDWLKGRKCERCGKKATDIHHKRGRMEALLCDIRHYASVCRKCHDWIGRNPNEARELGLLCEYGLWNTPDRT